MKKPELKLVDINKNFFLKLVKTNGYTLNKLLQICEL